MVEKCVDASRRKVVGAVVKGASAGLLFQITPAQASEKMTRQQAHYQDTPKDIYSCEVCSYSCEVCSLFEAPKYCKVVEGEVSKDGWCKAFAMAD
jgi:hypothetical protein